MKKVACYRCIKTGQLFRRLNKEDGLTLVVTTHNPKIGSQASKIIYLQDGRIVQANS